MYMESRKTVLMNVSAGQQRRHRYREQTYAQGGGKGGEGGMSGESNTEIRTTVCKIDSQWELAI